MITEDLFPELFGIDARDREGEYYRIFNSINSKMCTLLNQPTWKQGISTGALEIIIQNYEDGYTSEEEFCRCLDILGMKAENLGFDFQTVEDSDMAVLFGGEEVDAGEYQRRK